MQGTSGINELIDGAERTIGRALSGEDRRQVREAGQVARFQASNHASHQQRDITAERLNAIERDAVTRATVELIARVAPPAPVSGGSPEPTEAPRKAKPRAKAEPKLEPLPGPPSGIARLTLAINGVPYAVRGIPCDPEGAIRCYEVRRAGRPAYHVSEHPEGCRCTCGDYEFRRAGLDDHGCKHVRSLAAVGLLTIHPAPRRPGGQASDHPFGQMPRRIRSGQVAPPSQTCTPATDGPGLQTWRGGHPG